MIMAEHAIHFQKQHLNLYYYNNLQHNKKISKGKNAVSRFSSFLLEVIFFLEQPEAYVQYIVKIMQNMLTKYEPQYNTGVSGGSLALAVSHTLSRAHCLTRPCHQPVPHSMQPISSLSTCTHHCTPSQGILCTSY